MLIRHVVLKIYVPCKKFYVPSQYLYRPCKAYVYGWKNKYMPRLKYHLPSKLPSRAHSHKSLCALGQDLHAPGMRARLNVVPWCLISFNVWVRYFVRNFKGYLWNSTQNILPIHWKMWILFTCENLRALRIKSSYMFLKHSESTIHIILSPVFLAMSTHWGRDKMVAISQTQHFQMHFRDENVGISIKISLKFVPKALINDILAIVQIMLGADQATSHYLNQWWLSYRRIYVSLNELTFVKFILIA